MKDEIRPLIFDPMHYPEDREVIEPPPPASGSHYSNLRWHRLHEITHDGVGTIELLAATCIDGIGCMAQWLRQLDGTWEVWAWDTEGQGEMTRVINFGDDEPVPPTPPTVFDDVNPHLNSGTSAAEDGSSN